ncbi:C40 family peptidase [uncultured Draconibacterium sp.]|uniref:C40 family peptidase n=1 Tax=uncultured Draconibacterium sp. TaxID=1573823 RepID=UPI0032601837
MKSIHFLLLILLILSACLPVDTASIQQKVDEVGQKHIKGTRLLYWNIDVVNESNSVVLEGATASKSAHAELKKLAKQETLKFAVDILPSQKFQQYPWAVAKLSVCNIPSSGKHFAELLTKAILGMPLKVYHQKQGWYLVQTPHGYFGWVDQAGIALESVKDINTWKSLDKVLYKKSSGVAYAKVGENSGVEFDLVMANLLSIAGEEAVFYKIVLPDGCQGFVKKDECVSLDIWKNKNLTAEAVVNPALSFNGVPYLRGGTSAKMVDCSGFVKSAFYFHRLILQRDASQQTFYGELVDAKNGYDTLQPGDLVFFGIKATESQKERVTRVGMVIGNQDFIHASGKVRISSLNRNRQKYTEHYEKRFVRARTVLGNVDGKGIEWVVDNKFYKEILP